MGQRRWLPGVARAAVAVILLTASLAVVASTPAGASSVVPSPNPAGGVEGSLGSVSCVSASACVAVDTNFTEVWNGSVWTIVPLVNAGLFGVSCTSATACTAVGYSGNAEGVTSTLVESWNGAAWSVVPSPSPPAISGSSGAGSILHAVSCSTTSACVAVGGYQGPDTPERAPLIESWDGSTWTVVPAPALANPSQPADLFDVSCPFVNACTAVGSQGHGATQVPLVEMWNGLVWTILPSPDPGVGFGSQLLGASCNDALSCTYVGYSNLTSDGTVRRPVVMQSRFWKTIVWTTPALPTLGTATRSATLSGVSCVNANACMAVGSNDTAGGSLTLAEWWDGSVWSLVPSASPGTLGNLLSSVSCTSTRLCTAVGASSSGTWITLVELLTPPIPPLNRPVVGMAATPGGLGYWQVAADGGVFTYGDAGYKGSASMLALNKPMVGMAASPDGLGYWLVAGDGGVFTYGAYLHPRFYGSAAGLVLNKPVVGMAAAPDGLGYWLVAADGGVFAFGSAGFFGSASTLVLNKPVVGMAAAPDGLGYWLVAADGGVFAFGSAGFFGSASTLVLNKPVVGMAAAPDGLGYWLVAADGGVFAFGSAGFFGSASTLVLSKPVVGMAAAPDGKGYWLAGADGGVFSFGAAPFYGSYESR